MFNTNCYGNENIPSYTQGVETQWAAHTTHNSQGIFHQHPVTGNANAFVGYGLGQVQSKELDLAGVVGMKETTGATSTQAATNAWHHSHRVRYSSATANRGFLPYQMSSLPHYDSQSVDTSHLTHGTHHQPFWVANPNAYSLMGSTYQRDHNTYAERGDTSRSSATIRHNTAMPNRTYAVEDQSRNVNATLQQQPAPVLSQHCQRQSRQQIHQLQQHQHQQLHHQQDYLRNQMTQRERDPCQYTSNSYHQDSMRVSMDPSLYHEQHLIPSTQHQHQHQQYQASQEALRKASETERTTAFTSRQAWAQSWPKTAYVPFDGSQTFLSNHRSSGSAFQPCSKQTDSDPYSMDSIWAKSAVPTPSTHVAHAPNHTIPPTNNHMPLATQSWLHDTTSHLKTNVYRPPQDLSQVANVASNFSTNVLNLDTGQVELSMSVVPPELSIYPQSVQQAQRHRASTSHPLAPAIQTNRSLPTPAVPQTHLKPLVKEAPPMKTVEPAKPTSTARAAGLDVRQFLATWDEDLDLATPRPAIVEVDEPEPPPPPEPPSTSLVVLDYQNVPSEEAAGLLQIYPGLQLGGNDPVVLLDNAHATNKRNLDFVLSRAVPTTVSEPSRPTPEKEATGNVQISKPPSAISVAQSPAAVSAIPAVSEKAPNENVGASPCDTSKSTNGENQADLSSQPRSQEPTTPASLGESDSERGKKSSLRYFRKRKAVESDASESQCSEHAEEVAAKTMKHSDDTQFSNWFGSDSMDTIDGPIRTPVSVSSVSYDLSSSAAQSPVDPKPTNSSEVKSGEPPSTEPTSVSVITVNRYHGKEKIGRSMPDISDDLPYDYSGRKPCNNAELENCDELYRDTNRESDKAEVMDLSKVMENESCDMTDRETCEKPDESGNINTENSKDGFTRELGGNIEKENANIVEEESYDVPKTSQESLGANKGNNANVNEATLESTDKEISCSDHRELRNEADKEPFELIDPARTKTEQEPSVEPSQIPAEKPDEQPCSAAEHTVGTAVDNPCDLTENKHNGDMDQEHCDPISHKPLEINQEQCEAICQEFRNDTSLEPNNDNRFETCNQASLAPRHNSKLESRNETSLELRNDTSLELRDDTSLEVRDDTNLELRNDTSLELCDDTSLQLRDTSLELRDTCLELRDTSLELRDTSLELRDTSLELRDDTSHEVSKDFNDKTREELSRKPSDFNLELQDMDQEIRDEINQEHRFENEQEPHKDNSREDRAETGQEPLDEIIVERRDTIDQDFCHSKDDSRTDVSAQSKPDNIWREVPVTDDTRQDDQGLASKTDAELLPESFQSRSDIQFSEHQEISEETSISAPNSPKTMSENTEETTTKYLSRIVGSAPGKIPKILLSRLRDVCEKSRRKNGARKLPSIRLTRVQSGSVTSGDELPEYALREGSCRPGEQIQDKSEPNNIPKLNDEFSKTVSSPGRPSDVKSRECTPNRNPSPVPVKGSDIEVENSWSSRRKRSRNAMEDGNCLRSSPIQIEHGSPGVAQADESIGTSRPKTPVSPFELKMSSGALFRNKSPDSEVKDFTVRNTISTCSVREKRRGSSNSPRTFSSPVLQKSPEVIENVNVDLAIARSSLSSCLDVSDRKVEAVPIEDNSVDDLKTESQRETGNEQVRVEEDSSEKMDVFSDAGSRDSSEQDRQQSPPPAEMGDNSVEKEDSDDDSSDSSSVSSKTTEKDDAKRESDEDDDTTDKSSVCSRKDRISEHQSSVRQSSNEWESGPSDDSSSDSEKTSVCSSSSRKVSSSSSDSSSSENSSDESSDDEKDGIASPDDEDERDRAEGDTKAAQDEMASAEADTSCHSSKNDIPQEKEDCLPDNQEPAASDHIQTADEDSEKVVSDSLLESCEEKTEALPETPISSLPIIESSLVKTHWAEEDMTDASPISEHGDVTERSLDDDTVSADVDPNDKTGSTEFSDQVEIIADGTQVLLEEDAVLVITDSDTGNLYVEGDVEVEENTDDCVHILVDEEQYNGLCNGTMEVYSSDSMKTFTVDSRITDDAPVSQDTNEEVETGDYYCDEIGSAPIEEVVGQEVGGVSCDIGREEVCGSWEGSDGVPVPVESLGDWPSIEEIISKKAGWPSAEEGPLQVKCSLSWDRILKEGQGLVLGPANVEVRVPGEAPKENTHWKVVTRERKKAGSSKNRSCVEENNNLMPDLKSPIIVVKRLVLKRPRSRRSQRSKRLDQNLHNQDSAFSEANPLSVSPLKTKAALKAFQAQTNQPGPRSRNKSWHASSEVINWTKCENGFRRRKSDLSPSVANLNGSSPQKLPKVIIKRTGEGPEYQSFICENDVIMQPVVSIERNAVLDNLAMNMWSGAASPTSSEGQMSELSETKDSQSMNRSDHSKRRKTRNVGRTGQLMKVVELLQQWRRAEQDEASKISKSDQSECDDDTIDNNNSLLCVDHNADDDKYLGMQECSYAARKSSPMRSFTNDDSYNKDDKVLEENQELSSTQDVQKDDVPNESDCSIVDDGTTQYVQERSVGTNDLVPDDALAQSVTAQEDSFATVEENSVVQDELRVQAHHIEENIQGRTATQETIVVPEAVLQEEVVQDDVMQDSIGQDVIVQPSGIVADDVIVQEYNASGNTGQGDTIIQEADSALQEDSYVQEADSALEGDVETVSALKGDGVVVQEADSVLQEDDKMEHEYLEKEVLSEVSCTEIAGSGRNTVDDTPEQSRRTSIEEGLLCHVCGFTTTLLEEQANHIKTHSYHCQRCQQAFISHDDFKEHLAAVHPTIEELHHCLLCQRTFPTAERHAQHKKGWHHSQMERSQCHTIHSLFRLFTGNDCPYIPSLSIEETKAFDWLPSDPGVIHFYHDATPLQLAVQDCQEAKDDGSTP